MKPHDSYSRRDFIGITAAATVFWMTPTGLWAKSPEEEDSDQPLPPAVSKGFRFAQIGCGNQGAGNLRSMIKAGGTLVAMCDVDEITAANMYKRFPDVPKYKDFRKMLEEMKDKIDGVVVSTPDHVHAVMGLAVLRLKKHLYLQKPLAHTFEECDLLLEAAKKSGVVTQMGNQGHSGNGLKLWEKMNAEEAFGEIKEIHVWTNRAHQVKGSIPPQEEPVPPTLDWDLWLGPQSNRPYSKAYLPFLWRGWWDFGCGSLGDMACHNMDPIFAMFELGHPTAVKAETSAPAAVSYPEWAIIDFTFGPSPKAPQGLKFRWYDGKKLPPLPPNCHPSYKLDKEGCMVIGSKLTAIGKSHAGAPVVVALAGQPYGPAVKEEELKWTKVLKTLVKEDHFEQWVDAALAKDPSKTGSKFEYAAPLTQAILIGAISLRFPGKELQWDALKREFSNCPEANQFLKTNPRDGYDMSV